jgi:hypothetical protein
MGMDLLETPTILLQSHRPGQAGLANSGTGVIFLRCGRYWRAAAGNDA